MTLFDLLFLLLMLVTLVCLLWTAILVLRGRIRKGATLLARVAMAAVLYFVVIAIVSVSTPQRIVSLDDAQCSDDWCMAVHGDRVSNEASGTRHVVAFRLSSRARRVAQREHQVVVYLRDANGTRYDPVPDASSVPFDTLLQAGESVDAERQFVVPRATVVSGVVMTREAPGRALTFPGCCIIADEGSLLHKRTIVRLP